MGFDDHQLNIFTIQNKMQQRQGKTKQRKELDQFVSRLAKCSSFFHSCEAGNHVRDISLMFRVNTHCWSYTQLVE